MSTEKQTFFSVRGGRVVSEPNAGATGFGWCGCHGDLEDIAPEGSKVEPVGAAIFEKVGVDGVCIASAPSTILARTAWQRYSL